MLEEKPRSCDSRRRIPIKVQIDEHNKVTADPNAVRLCSGPPVTLVFKLHQPPNMRWKFRHDEAPKRGYFFGIFIHDDLGEFPQAKRIDNSEVHLFDQNDVKRIYKYSITLIEEASEDPTIENRADG